MRLVNRWRQYRVKRQLTQKELGEKIGLSKQMISKIERGDAHTTTETIEEACKLFNCQPGDLYQMVEDASEESDSFFVEKV
jgi:DNA-binding Xre family transcriptional regulator